MEKKQRTVQISIIFFLITISFMMKPVKANWCVARSEASNQALQTAIDYACGSGADCTPLQSTGLCFLPNTIQAHASYAFNSYFQRKNMGPGSCEFSGTATVAQTDPSYGSCVYPSSLSTAGGAITPPTPAIPTITNNPNVPVMPTTVPPPYGIGISGGGNIGMPPTFLPDSSKAYSQLTIRKMLLQISCLAAISFILHPMVVIL